MVVIAVYSIILLIHNFALSFLCKPNSFLFFSLISRFCFFLLCYTQTHLHEHTNRERERERERQRSLLWICGWLTGIEIDACGSMRKGLDACGEDRCLRERRVWLWERGEQKDREVFWKGDRVERTELRGIKVERRGRCLRWNVRDNRHKDKIKWGKK